MSDYFYKNNEVDHYDADPKIAAIISRLSLDFEYFCASCLKIVDKEGNLIPFVLNPIQKRLLKKLESNTSKPIRKIIVKARQLGCSTFISAYYFWKVLTNKHISCLITADELKNAQSLLQKAHVFLDNLPEILRPVNKYRSKNELYFENLNSSFQIDTATNASLGRSRTFQLVHLSEVAYFANGKDALLSLRQTVADKPNTSIILESTANGLDNIFYEEVQRSLRNESDYEVIFFPWFANSEYTLGEDTEFELTEKEKDLKQQFKLTFGQLRWRRRAITDKCQDSEDLFCQEYPSTLEEAFRYTGHPVFDLARLSSQAQDAPPPSFIGNLNLITNSLEESKNSTIKIWEYPQPDNVYLIGLDSAEGKENTDLKRDYSVIQVFNAFNKEQVAVYRSQEAWDIVAYVAVWLAKFYNKAYLVIESNNHGLAVISKVRDLHYPFLYKERDYNETGIERQERIGFRSTNRSKPMLISFFAEMFRDGFIRMNDRVTLDEMSKFSQDSTGRLRASIGHDDTVMSAALAIWGLRYAPITRKIPVKEEEIRWLPKMGEQWSNQDEVTGIETAWVRKMFKWYIPKDGFN